MSACGLGRILKELNHSHSDSYVRNEGAKGLKFLLSQSSFLSLTYYLILQHFCHWTVSRDNVINK
jgi:hypothetical protein